MWLTFFGATGNVSLKNIKASKRGLWKVGHCCTLHYISSLLKPYNCFVWADYNLWSSLKIFFRTLRSNLIHAGIYPIGIHCAGFDLCNVIKHPFVFHGKNGSCKDEEVTVKKWNNINFWVNYSYNEAIDPLTRLLVWSNSQVYCLWFTGTWPSK